MAVTKSWVEAHPTDFTAFVASISRITASSTESRLDLSISISATVFISSSRSRAAQRVLVSACTCPRICASSAGTPPALGVLSEFGWVVMSEFKHRPLTGSVENPLVWKEMLSGFETLACARSSTTDEPLGGARSSTTGGGVLSGFETLAGRSFLNRLGSAPVRRTGGSETLAGARSSTDAARALVPQPPTLGGWCLSRGVDPL